MPLLPVVEFVKATECIRVCLHGSGWPRGGEVPHLPMVKKYLSSHATLATRGEAQNAIVRSLSTHINKELNVCFLHLF